MTKVRLQERVEFWQRKLSLLGLGHWRFTINLVDHIDDEVDDDPAARADTSPFYDDVEFSFKRSVVDKREREGKLDELIVHEWLHVADRDHHHLVRQLVDELGSEASGLMTIREEQARESRIDRLSRLIVTLAA